MTKSVDDQLLDVLEELSEEKLKTFHRYLQDPGVLAGFPAIEQSRLETADTLDTVDLMVAAYNDDPMTVAGLILRKINEGQSEEQTPQHLLQYAKTVLPLKKNKKKTRTYCYTRRLTWAYRAVFLVQMSIKLWSGSAQDFLFTKYMCKNGKERF
uniref:Pyrin domain-containing protein n=1 Tax=Amphilophus citrinellus TaxID=61819 RepID=A0A3Q0SJU9_AMPCI